MLWAKLLLIPRPYLYAGITVFSALGIYATSGSTFDLLLLLGIGLLGFLLRALDFPLAPLIIGMVLGPLAETSLRDAAMSANGDFSVLVQGPITLTLYALLALVLLFSVRGRIVARRRERQPEKETVAR
jgi:putative tricarboxylic transport membrane protein